MEQPSKSENYPAASGEFTSARSRRAIDTTALHPSIAAERGPLQLIPWNAIWPALQAARLRGHGAMIQAFFETLFNEAMFDDQGAWSQDRHRQK